MSIKKSPKISKTFISGLEAALGGKIETYEATRAIRGKTVRYDISAVLLKGVEEVQIKMKVVKTGEL